MTNLCNVDGAILPESEAAIPVLDRGFLFGDSIYEVLCTRSGVPFAIDLHLARLRISAAGLGIEFEYQDREIIGRIKKTMAAAGNPESYVRIIVTRGTGSAPNIDLTHAPGPNRWVILVRQNLVERGQPARLAIVPRLRNDRRALDPGIKSGNYLNNVLGLAEARARGATDCLFLNQAGYVTEASTSNFFLAKDDVLFTPPLTAGLLKGVTRTLLLKCCGEVGVEVHERDLTTRDVEEADELFLSGTVKDIAPVIDLGGKPVSDGEPGPLTTRLMAAFETFCDRRSEAVDKRLMESVS